MLASVPEFQQLSKQPFLRDAQGGCEPPGRLDSPDGRWIYFQPNHQNIYRMAAQGGPAQQVSHFAESGLFIEEPTISPDGRYLLYNGSNGGSSLWLLRIGGNRSEHE